MQNEVVQSRHSPKLPFLLLWIGGTTAGWAFGILPAMILITGALSNGNLTDHPTGSTMASNLILSFCGLVGFVLASGFAVSGSQWLALQERLPGFNDKWFNRSAVCVAVGWFLGWVGSIVPFSMSHSDSKLGAFVASGIVIGTLIGSITGIAQWRLLRQQLTNAGWWIGASILGWISALVLYWIVYRAMGGPFETVVTSYYEGSLWPKTVAAPGALPAMLAGWIVGGLALGTITGITMKRLIRPQRQTIMESQ